MITMWILWALIIGLFAINPEQSNERERLIMQAKGHAITDEGLGALVPSVQFDNRNFVRRARRFHPRALKERQP